MQNNQNKLTDNNVEMTDADEVDDGNARNPTSNYLLNLVSASISSSTVNQPFQSLNNRGVNL